MTQELIFFAFATLITIASVMVVISRNAVASAVFLVGDLFLLAGLYASLEAHFIAAIQILVYAGAIVVLFMFVIMLLNLAPDETRRRLSIPAPEFAVLIVTVVGFFLMGGMVLLGHGGASVGDLSPAAITSLGGNTFAVGMVLFTRYLWPFELASFLILLAIVASVVIAKKDKVPNTEARSPNHG